MVFNENMTIEEYKKDYLIYLKNVIEDLKKKRKTKYILNNIAYFDKLIKEDLIIFKELFKNDLEIYKEYGFKTYSTTLILNFKDKCIK